MKKFLQKIYCFLGFHKYVYSVDNIQGYCYLYTIGTKQCDCCAKSKINFIFCNK